MSHLLCTKLGGDELSALPRTFILMWSSFCSLKFITMCLKTRSKLEALSFTASNVWEHGFVLIFNCISHQISLISAARSLLQLPQISGDMYFSLSLLFHICFNFFLHICAFVLCCRHWPAYSVEWKGNVVALPSILHPFSEGCSNRLFFEKGRLQCCLLLIYLYLLCTTFGLFKPKEPQRKLCVEKLEMFLFLNKVSSFVK